MSFNTISIQRNFPVVNGFVQVPNNLDQDKNALIVSEFIGPVSSSAPLAASNVGVVSINGAGSQTAGGKFCGQQFVTYTSKPGDVIGQMPIMTHAIQSGDQLGVPQVGAFAFTPAHQVAQGTVVVTPTYTDQPDFAG